MAARQGFIPSRQPVADYVRNLPASAGGNQTISKGDAVALVNGVIVPCTAGQDPNQMGYGVVLAVYQSNGRPLTFNNTKYIASGTAGRVDVCFDPNLTYYVQCVTSVGPSNIGKNVTLDVSAANASTGISGHAVSIPASASTNDLFKILNIGPFDERLTLGGLGTTNNGVEVRWNRQFLRAPVAGQ